MTVYDQKAEPWKVTLLDTGDNSMTGSWLLRVKEYVKDEETFCFTYGDGESDIDIIKFVAFHKEYGNRAIITVVTSPERFGTRDIHDNYVIYMII